MRKHTAAWVSLTCLTAISAITPQTVSAEDEIPPSGQWVRFVETVKDAPVEPRSGGLAPAQSRLSGKPYSDDLADLMRTAEHIVTADLDNYAGLEVASYDELTVLVVDPDGPGTSQLRAADSASSASIRFEQVPISWNKAQAAASEITSGRFGVTPTYIDFDERAGRLRLQLQDQAYARRSQKSSTVSVRNDPGRYLRANPKQMLELPAAGPRVRSVDLETVSRELTIPLDVAIEEPTILRPTAGPRNASSAPFAAGAKIKNYARASSCSLGIPILISGRRTVATAAHCSRTAQSNPNEYQFVTSAATGNLVGRLAFSVRHSAAHQYSYKFGDWMLLSGGPANYGLSMYTGSSTSSTTAPLTGGDFTLVTKGASVSSSGARTGFITNYRVANNKAVYTSCDGQGTTATCQYINYMVQLEHVGPGGRLDDIGARPGDSGGAVVRADPQRPGQYWGLGLMSQMNFAVPAGADPKDESQRYNYRWYYSSLQGIRAYAPDATVVK